MKREETHNENKTAWSQPKMSLIDIKKTLSGGASSSDGKTQPTG